MARRKEDDGRDFRKYLGNSKDRNTGRNFGGKVDQDNEQDEDEEEAHPSFAKMPTKQRADDDLGHLPTVETNIEALNGRAHFFVGKGDIVVDKLYKMYPEVEVAVEDVEIPDRSGVLVLSSAEGFIGVALAATHPRSQFYLYDANLGLAAVSQRNVEANSELCPNAQVVSDEELETLLQQGKITMVVYRPPGFTAMQLIEDRIAFGSAVLPDQGQLYLITNKKSGAARHEEMMKSTLGSRNVEVVGRGGGGFRVIRGIKTAEAIAQEPQSLQQVVSFDTLGYGFQVMTEPSLFSKENLDIGTRFLLETVDITHFERMLDIGCGWGAIGLVAATLNPTGEVVMTDIDTRAVRVAEQNVQAFGLQERVEVVATDNIRTIGGNFDLILSNPPFHADTKILHALFNAARDKLAKKGIAYLVIEKSYVEKFRTILEEQFGNVTVVAENPDIKFSILAVRK
jgi:16S rRNA (guanine1207-N2)-methyltransferase